MPEISRFLGIVVRIRSRDHPPPHFHVTYAGEDASIDIDSLRVGGRLPPRVLGLVIEWAAVHRDALRTNWARAQARLPLQPIEPLK